MVEAVARMPAVERWINSKSRRLSLAFALTAGFSDAFGFLRLHGLLTSHVTGDLAFMAVGIARGNPHILMKFLAVPIFVVWVACGTWVIGRKTDAFAGLAAGLRLEIAFMVLASVATLAMAAPRTADDPSAVVVGTLLLGAMGTQNALMRKSFSRLPSTTAMTTNISEATVRWVTAMLDPAQHLDPKERSELRQTARRVTFTVSAFAIGAIFGGLSAFHLGAAGLLPPIALLLYLLILVSHGRAGQAPLKS